MADEKGTNAGFAMAKLAVEWAEKVKEAGEAFDAGDAGRGQKLLEEAEQIKRKIYQTGGVPTG